MHPLQALAEVLLPALRQCGNVQGALYRLHFAVSVPFRDIEARDFRYRDGVCVLGQRFDFVVGAHFALTSDGEVETSAAAGEEAPYHVIRLKPDTQLVARKAGLGHDHARGTDGELIAQMNGTLQQAIGGEVFSKDSHRKFPSGQVLPPNAIVLDGVAVDGFVLASVNGKVGLTVAVQVEGVQGDTALDGLLE